MGTSSTLTAMGWLTPLLCLSLAIAITIVHRPESASAATSASLGQREGNAKELDQQNILNLATKYLGKDGVEKLMTGDFSQLEDIGPQVLGGEVDASQMLGEILGAIPDGVLGDKTAAGDATDDAEEMLE